LRACLPQAGIPQRGVFLKEKQVYLICKISERCLHFIDTSFFVTPAEAGVQFNNNLTLANFIIITFWSFGKKGYAFLSADGLKEVSR